MGGGIGMGNTCKPMAVSFQCMTKFTTNLKKRQSIGWKNIFKVTYLTVLYLEYIKNMYNSVIIMTINPTENGQKI